MKFYKVINEKTGRKLGFSVESGNGVVYFTSKVAKEADVKTSIIKDEKKATLEEFKGGTVWYHKHANTGDELKRALENISYSISNVEDLILYYSLIKKAYKPEKVKTTKKLVYKGGISVILHSEDEVHGEYETYQSSTEVTLIFKTKKAIKDVAKIAKNSYYKFNFDAKKVTEDFDKGRKHLRINAHSSSVWSIIRTIADGHYGILKDGFYLSDHNEYSSTRVEKKVQYPFQTLPADEQVYLGTTADSTSLSEYIDGLRGRINAGEVHYYPEISTMNLTQMI